MGCVGDYVACVGCVDCVTWGYLGARILRKDRGIDRGVELVVGVGQFSAQRKRASDMELIGGGDAQADTPTKSRGACDMIGVVPVGEPGSDRSRQAIDGVGHINSGNERIFDNSSQEDVLPGLRFIDPDAPDHALSFSDI